MNLNELARKVSQIEAGKQEVNIAQIKEIISKMGLIFAYMSAEDLTKLISKMIAAGKR